MIYFIEAVGAGLLKIGFTERDPEDRLRELQTASPHSLRLVATMVGGLKREGELHEGFAHLRTTGEWFRIDQELRAFLAVAKWVIPRLEQVEREVLAAVNEMSNANEQIVTLQAFAEAHTRRIREEAKELADHLGFPETMPVLHVTDRIRRQVLEEAEFNSSSGVIAFLESGRGR